MGTYNQVGNGFTQPAVPMPRYASPYLGSPAPKPAGYPAFDIATAANNFTGMGDVPVGTSGAMNVPALSGLGLSPQYPSLAGTPTMMEGVQGGLNPTAGLTPSATGGLPLSQMQFPSEISAANYPGLGGDTASSWGFDNPFKTDPTTHLNSLGMTNFDTLKGGIGLLTSGVNAYSALQGVGLAKKQFAQSADQWNKNWAGKKTAFNDKIASDAEAAYARNGGTSLTPDEAVAKRGIH